MDDTDSKLSLKVSKFKIACEQLFDIDVELEDERLTTWEAKQIMSDKNNLTDKKTTSHALAAKIILDTWLNRK
jgi:putative transcription antitermination factor YqgF